MPAACSLARVLPWCGPVQVTLGTIALRCPACGRYVEALFEQSGARHPSVCGGCYRPPAEEDAAFDDRWRRRRTED